MANIYNNLDFSKNEDRITLARIIAEEGIVLLKNENNILPLGKKKIALFGRTQIDTIKGGTGSANSTCDYSVSIQQGLIDAGLRLDSVLARKYVVWAKKNPIPSYGVWGSGMHANPEMPITEEICKASFERGSKIAVVVIGRTAGENEDVALTEGDYYLSNEEREMLSNVKKYFEHIVLILNIGNVMDLNFISEYGIEGVVYMNMAGMEGGHAVGNIVSGKAVPSGHLTATFANSYDVYPSSEYFGQRRGGLLQDYKEDIFIGYRYFDTFNKNDAVIYPFGFGLSYTTFKVSHCKYECDGKTITASAVVKNTGRKYSGKYVWQVYVSAPQMGTGRAKLSKPAKVLVGYAKTDSLLPGKEQTVKVSFPVASMASYDDTGVTKAKHAWVLEAGKYDILAGDSVLSTKKIGTYKQPKFEVIEKCHEIPTALNERLLADGTYEKLKAIAPNPKVGLLIASEGRNSFSAFSFADHKGAKGGVFKIGDSLTYKFVAGTSGRYYFSFVSNVNDSRKFSDVATVLVNNVEVSNIDSVIVNGESEKSVIVIPSGTFTFKVVAKAEFSGINELCFEKIASSSVIHEKGVTEIGAEDYYESSYSSSVEVYPDDGNGKPCSLLGHMSRSGNFAVFKLNVEKGGVYDFWFRYANFTADMTTNECMAIFVSNVGQSIADVKLYKTCERYDANRNLKVSAPVQIALPNGECYLKLVVGMKRIPDLNTLYFKRNENVASESIGKTTSVKSESFSQLQLEGLSEPNVYDSTPVEKKGIQLKEVYKNPALMDAFLAQLSNEELATIVSGSAHNNTPLGASGTSHRLMERGVNGVQSADGPLGLRLNAMTVAYPSGTLLASSWDSNLEETYGLAIGHEAKELKVDAWLAPAINLHRDPRCGRNFEYFSEDPLIAGRTAANISKGVQSQKVAVTVKHYCVNNTEHERLKSNSRVSERAIRELYIRSFEIAIKEGDPWCIMSSYNHANNVKVAETRVLINDIPRDEWHWTGVFMTDWGNSSNHVLELKAGHDLKMCSGDINGVKTALDNGVLTREEVMICAKRVLNLVMRTNTFLDTL